MADVLVIDGSTINLVTFNASIDLLIPYAKGGMPELHLSRLVGALAALPDAWSGKACTLTMGGTLVFSGRIQGYCDHYVDSFGWTREYRALGLLNESNYIPITDDTSLTDSSTWNLPGDDPSFVGSRAGKNVGEIVEAILTMLTNAVPLDAAGIGAYTSLSPPTLPSATTTDLAALTVIPPWRVVVSGERILQSLEAFVQTCHPNHFLHVEPDGTIRLLDTRAFSGATLTLGGDPRLGMPSLTRDYTDSYSQVEVRGNTRVEGIYLQTLPWPGSALTDGGLQEDFAWGALSNAAAKAAWTPECWVQPYNNGTAADEGTCTCPSTTTVTVTSSDTAMTWPANYWGQGAGESLGIVYLYSETLAGTLTNYVSRRVVSNTALTAGGTSTLTLDLALPATSFAAYKLWGLAQNCGLVGRRYKVTNTALGHAMQNFFPYPFLFKNATGTAATMTSTPISQISYSASGLPPYNVAFAGMQIDPVAGLIYFSPPVQTIFGMGVWPTNVEVFVPVAVGNLAAYAPSSSTFDGTLHTIEGIDRRKTITLLDWRDYSNQAAMDLFASEFLDSVKDVVVEGVVPYYGLLTTHLTPGHAVSIAGSGYTTGWESLALPVVACEIAFQSGVQGTSYMMALHVSNRRGRYTAESFLRPNITGMAYGSSGGETMTAGGPTMSQGLGLGREAVDAMAALGVSRAEGTGPKGAAEGAAAGGAGFDNADLGTQSPGMVDMGEDTAKRDKYGRAKPDEYNRKKSERLEPTTREEQDVAEQDRKRIAADQAESARRLEGKKARTSNTDPLASAYTDRGESKGSELTQKDKIDADQKENAKRLADRKERERQDELARRDQTGDIVGGG